MREVGHDLSFSQAKTQPIRAIRRRRSRLRRFVLFLFFLAALLAMFVSGFAFGRGMEIQAAARAIVATAMAALPATSVPSQPIATAGRLTPMPSPIPPTPSAIPSASPVPPTATAIPTATVIPPTATASPIPTATAIPSASPVPPTATPVPPTSTPLPRATSVPASPTPRSSSCYSGEQAWVWGAMNVREGPSVSAAKVYVAEAGEYFRVLESRQGATYCWLRIDKGWMAQTAFVSSTKPQPRIPGTAGGGVRQALITLSTLVVASENRCSPYDSDSYPYSQSVEPQIVARMGGRIYGPYTGTTFSSTSETDIEHIVAKSEAHDSGLCGASAERRRAFAGDLLNLTLAAPSVNRHQKSGKDFAEWTPAWNKCWFADTIIKVKFKYRLTVDSRERAALERTLLGCTSVDMVFASAVSQPAQPQAQPAQKQAQPPQQQAQPAQTANSNWRQWDTNGNGRITCAEARAAGIAPVHRGHPAYPRMDDRDNDGVVCE